MAGVKPSMMSDATREAFRSKLSVLSGTNGKKYKIVSCVLRNTGAGWGIIDDANHKSVGVASVTNDTSGITINYDFVASKVGSLVCCPDEEFSIKGYSFGASAGTTLSIVKIGRLRSIAGYITFNGTDWVITAGSEGITSVTFNNTTGEFRVNHEDIGTTFDRNMSIGNAVYLLSPGSVAAAFTKGIIRDYAGNPVLVADINMKVFFNARTRQVEVNPPDLVSAGGNIWVYGVFEVD